MQREEELVRSNALDLTAQRCRFGQRPKWGWLDLVAVGCRRHRKDFAGCFTGNRHHLRVQCDEEFYRVERMVKVSFRRVGSE